MLIDDAKPERELLGIWLEESGRFTVVGEAADGPSGVALAAELRPELVVLDLSMPGGDGIKALTEILSVSPLCRVVVFSGFLTGDMASALVRLGASACLDKGAGPARLITELLRLVDIPGGPAEIIGLTDGSNGLLAVLEREVPATSRLAAIVESSGDAVIEGLLDGTVTSWNAGAERIYGYTAQEMIGRSGSVLAPPGRPDDMRDALRQVARGEAVASHETQGTRKDGSVVEVAVTLSPIRDSSGTVTGVSAIARDITERKRADEAVGRLAAIVESSGDAIIGKRLDGTITSWNGGAERLYGYTGAEMIGANMSLLIPPDRPDELPDLLLRVGRGEQVAHHEARRIRKDGSAIDVAVTLSPIRDASGTVTGVSAIARDITERKRADEAVGRLAAIVESSDDAIVGGLLDGTVTSWNAGAERLYGYSAEEMIGESGWALIPPRIRADVDGHLLRVGDGQEELTRGESRRIRKDGSTVEVAVTLSPICDRSGTVTGVSAIARDITERKRAEAVVAGQVEELRRSNAELQQFAYVASHDLSEPLRTISGYVELLERRYQGQLDEDADRFIKHTVDGCNRLRTLLDDLLAYSRAGRGDELAALVDVNTTVSEVVASLAASLDAVGGVVEFDGLPELLGDPAQLVHLFQNLIANSLKFARPNTPPRVRITAARQDDIWTFSIDDNGIGIEAEYRERIFGMFQRLHARDAYPGTGIGLAICKRIVEAHGGRIWVEQNADGGSRFCFTAATRDREHG